MRVKAILNALLTLIVVLYIPGSASGAGFSYIIGFEYPAVMTGNYGSIPPDYYGLSWNGLEYVQNAYGNHISSSGNYAATNTVVKSGITLSLNPAANPTANYFNYFDLNSFNLRKIQKGDFVFTLIGTKTDFSAISSTFTIKGNNTGYNTYSFDDFNNLISLDFLATNAGGQIRYFDIDEISISTPEPASEPAAVGLGLIGLAGLLILRRKNAV